jgi:ribonucleoside-diphosphate reductase alpha chain
MAEMSKIAQEIWVKKYKHATDSRVEDMWARVAGACTDVEQPGVRQRYRDEFYKALEDFKFIPAGRILSAAGTGRRNSTAGNCYVMGTIEDSMEGIFQTVKEAAITQRQGGGVGFDFSTIRPAGERVDGCESDASGPVSFMQVFDSSCRTIVSAGNRRGAMLGALRCDHPDIERFIEAKRGNAALRMFNLSVSVTDKFMAAVKADSDWALVFNNKLYKTMRARDLWDKIMRATYDYAEPGVMFIDTVNNSNNLGYLEKIVTANPCVTGDTRLHTSKGMVRMDSLFDSKEPLTCSVDARSLGKEGRLCEPREAVPVFMTAESADVYLVETAAGYSVKATAWHEFYTGRGKLKLSDIHVGDELWTQSGKGLFGTEGDYALGLLLGALTGDGFFSMCSKEMATHLDLWDGKQGLAPELTAKINDMISGASPSDCSRMISPFIMKEGRKLQLKSKILTRELAKYGYTPETKLRVPEVVWRGTQDCMIGYLRGLFETDGTVNSNKAGDSCSIRLTSVDRTLLTEVQVLLANFGVYSSIKQRRQATVKALPDGKGRLREYACQAYHELIVDGESRGVFAKEVGFALPAKREKLEAWLEGRALYKKQRFASKIVSIRHIGKEAVYDTTQVDHNAVIFNGLVTGQCGEIFAPPYGVCLLGSINLTRFVAEPFTKTAAVDLDGIKNLTKVAVRMMDDVLDFCVYPLPQQEAEAKTKRRLGLGITGLADMLAMKGLRYDSPRARELAESVMESIKNAAYMVSCDLAEEKGAFPLFDYDKYSQGQFFKGLSSAVKDRVKAVGLRNSHLLAVAPTGTISLLAGNVSSGLEPVFALKYDRKIRTGKGDETVTEEVRDYAYATLVDSGMDPAEAAKHFQTADEVSIEGHLQMQACLQRHVDHSISKTVNIPADYPFDKFKDVYKRAHALGLKGCTTFRPSEHIQGILTKTEDRPKEVSAATKDREEALTGVTYKLKVPTTDDAFYITINDVTGTNGKPRPYEIFINTKNLAHAGWIVALTRTLSANFRREEDPSFLVDELLSVYDPNGGFFHKGKFVPSIPAAIGMLIEEHLLRIGLVAPKVKPFAELAAKVPEDSKAFCPQCSAREAVMSEGCLKCLSCGYSKCG